MDGLLPNTSLSHYRIVPKIDATGIDEVYLAQDTKLDRKVALKILPADVASNRDRMRRFSSEATIRGLIVRFRAGSKSDLGSEPSEIL